MYGHGKGLPDGIVRLTEEIIFAEPTDKIDVRFWLDLGAESISSSMGGICGPPVVTIPVPEPSTLLLLGAGLVVFAVLVFARKRFKN